MAEGLSSFFVVHNVRRWVKGLIQEGIQVLEWSVKMDDYMRSLGNAPREVGDNMSDMIFLHQQFFITALDAAYDWMKESIHHDIGLEDVLLEIDKLFPDIKDIRNMNAHDIEYYKKRGRKQEKFIYEEKGVFSADATSVIVTDGKYLIGGRLCLQDVVGYFEKIYPEIVKISRDVALYESEKLSEKKNRKK